MKALLLLVSVFGAFLLDAAFHFAAALVGFGPWRSSIAVVRSGSLGVVCEETTVAWVRLGPEAVLYEQYVVWPLVLLLVAAAYVRLVPAAPWWHGAVIAVAAAPFLLSALGVTGVLFLCAYAALLGAFCLLVTRRRLAT